MENEKVLNLILKDEQCGRISQNQPQNAEREVGRHVLPLGPHGDHQLQPRRELGQMPREESADRVAVVGPVVLGFAEGIDDDQRSFSRQATDPAQG